jgi:hypothetical protein
MKNAKMSTRRHPGAGLRKMSRSLHGEVGREEMERLEQQRIDFEHRARLARTNLYGLNVPAATGIHGWVDNTRR